MNSGFDPVVVAPSLWKVQTQTQQRPFRFGGSQVPVHLGSRGSGVMKINRPPNIPRPFAKGEGVKRKMDGSMEPTDADRARLMTRFDNIRGHLEKTVAGRARIGRWEQARVDILPLIQGASTFARLEGVEDVINQFRTKMLGVFDLLDIYED